MKTLRTLLIGTIVCLPLIGCLVQSLHPFFTEKETIDFPEIVGTWDVIQDEVKLFTAGEQKPWRFNKDSVEIVDEKGIRSWIKTTYFKVGDTVFVDSTAGNLDEQSGVGGWWALHVFPVHLISKVRIEEDTLTISPLNYKWVEEHKKELKKEIPFTTVNDVIQYTAATSEQWIAFLKKHKDTKGVFISEAYILKRCKDTDKKNNSKK